MPNVGRGTYNYIPGTDIPSMSKFGQSRKSGIYARLKGTRDVAKRVNVALSKVKGATIEGLRAAATHIRRDMDRTPPLIPILTGALRASWFIETHPNSTLERPLIIAGFGGSKVNYAVYVHEMTEPPYDYVSWTRPESGPKFLEYGLKRNTAQVVRIVAEYAGGAIK